MDSIIVIKCGGARDVDVDALCSDIAQIVKTGRRVIVVHGGSAEIAELANRLGVPQQVQVAPDGVSTRRTDAHTMEVVTLALAGAVKPQLVSLLVRNGVRALGLTGADVGLLRARRKMAQREVVEGRTVVVRDTFAGKLERVDGELLRELIARRVVPVLSPPALTSDGVLVNVDADRVAAAVAVVLGATALVLITAASGVQEDADDESTVMPVCAVAIEGHPAPQARGGMAVKLIAAREALRGGVPHVLIADGRRRSPVSAALAGAGTRVVLDPGRARVDCWRDTGPPAGAASPQWRAAT